MLWKSFSGRLSSTFGAMILAAGLTAVTAEVPAPEIKTPPPTALKVLQMNLWIEGAFIPNGQAQIIAQVVKYDPDIILFCEVKNRAGAYREIVANDLDAAGRHYYVSEYAPDCLVLSKYPIKSSKGVDSGVTALIDLGDGRQVHVYSMHLNYLEYACYLPRGYHGTTWERLPQRESDVNAVIAMNLKSKRVDAVRAAIADAAAAIKAGDLVIIGGDFNEPSHLDWTERTKDLYDRNGIVMPWHSTLALEQAGFQDTFRQLYPDEVKYPGFSFPMNTPEADLKRLTWAPAADERDRIDYIFYNRNAPVKLERAGFFGPDTTIVRGQRDQTKLAGDRIAPDGSWPTDHAAAFAEFRFVKKGQK